MSEYDIFDIETEIEVLDYEGEHTPVREYNVEISFTISPDSQEYVEANVKVFVCRGVSINVVIDTKKVPESVMVTDSQCDIVQAQAAKAAINHYNVPEEDDLYDDSMDGDHESALASAGFGTDEDYGDFGGNDDDW